MWDLLEKTMQQFKAYEQTIEDLCSLLKHIVLSICGEELRDDDAEKDGDHELLLLEENSDGGHQSTKTLVQSLLKKILNSLCAFYQLTLHPAVLDALKVTAGFVDKGSEVYSMFCAAFAPICSLTFAPLLQGL